MRRLLRGGVLTTLCGLALLFAVGTASAHSRLESSNPANGASLATSPATVSLTFNEQMQQGFATLTVIGPGNTAWQSGDTQVSGDTVSVAVKPLGPAGTYQIGYRVVSDDGHPVSGSVSFTLTTPGPGVASATPAAPSTSTAAAAAPSTSAPVAAPAVPADDGGSPVWPWIVGAVVLVAGGVFAALRLGKS